MFRDKNFDDLNQQFDGLKLPTRILSLDDIRNEASAPIEYILYPWLNVQGLAIIFAERGVGKTYFSFAAARAIAQGCEIMKWNAEIPRKVLYVDGEMQFFSVKERVLLMDQLFGKDCPPENFNIITPDKYNREIPNLATQVGQQIIDEHLEETGADILWIDNISSLMPTLKSNDNDFWNANISPWLLNLRKHGKSVVMVHHAGKPKKDEPPSGRGASSKEDLLDTVISLTRPADYTPADGARFNIEFTKNRHFSGMDAMGFEAWLKQDESGNSFWYTDNIKESSYLLVCKMINDGAKQKDVANSLRLSKQRVSKLVQKGIRENKITRISDQFTG